MKNTTTIIRNEATPEVLTEIYRVLRKAIKELANKGLDVKEYFYTEKELKERN